MTRPEKNMCMILESLGFKIEDQPTCPVSSCPQYRIEKYLLDFALPHIKIDIEVDGEYWHGISSGIRVVQKLHDLERDNRLRSLGWQVIRVPAKWTDHASLLKKDLWKVILRSIQSNGV